MEEESTYPGWIGALEQSTSEELDAGRTYRVSGLTPHHTTVFPFLSYPGSSECISGVAIDPLSRKWREGDCHRIQRKQVEQS